MTAKEMFEALGYKETMNNKNLIEYKNDRSETYVSFNRMWETYEAGFYDGYEVLPFDVSIEEHEAITKKMKELGWI